MLYLIVLLLGIIKMALEIYIFKLPETLQLIVQNEEEI